MIDRSKLPNSFEFVVTAGARARQLLAGSTPRVAVGEHKKTTIAQREVITKQVEKREKVEKIDLWYVTQLAYFLEKMEATKDVDGNSLLHNSQIVYGSGNSDGNRHTHTNLPLLLAGGGGGTLTAGRYVKQGGVPMSNMLLSLADRMGVQKVERLGDSTGRLSNV